MINNEIFLDSYIEDICHCMMCNTIVLCGSNDILIVDYINVLCMDCAEKVHKLYLSKLIEIGELK